MCPFRGSAEKNQQESWLIYFAAWATGELLQATVTSAVYICTHVAGTVKPGIILKPNAVIFVHSPTFHCRSTQVHNICLLVSSLSLTITGSFHTTGFWVISNMFDMALMDIKHVWYLRFEIGEALIKSVALQVISVNPSLYQIVGVDNWFEAALNQEGLCSYRKERIELDPRSAQLSSSLGPTLAACDNGQRYRCPFLLCLG